MKKILIILVAAAVLSAGAYFYLSNQPTKIVNPLPMPSYGKITVEHAAPLFDGKLPEDYAIVDVRTVEEFAKINTKGTINVPVAIFEDSDEPCKEVLSKLPEGKQIIFVCPFGPRSQEMYETLTASKEDLGCGMKKNGLFHLWAKIKYKPEHIIVKKR